MWVETLFIGDKEYTIDEFNKLVSKGVNATVEIAKQYLTEYNNGNYKNWSDDATKVNVTEVHTINEVFEEHKQLGWWFSPYSKNDIQIF